MFFSSTSLKNLNLGSFNTKRATDMSSMFRACTSLTTLDVSNFDSIICGSDQIWNIKACDFSWLYFLDFNTNASKISYACSMGTSRIDLNSYEQNKIKELLSDFKYISVRDENTKETLEAICKSDFDVNIDPTLLLTKNEWINLIKRTNCSNRTKKYIFF